MSRKNISETQSSLTKKIVILAIVSIVLAATIVFVLMKVNKGQINFEDSIGITKSHNEDIKKNVDDDKVIATAQVMSTGDMLIHTPLLKGALQSDGTYDFTKSFTHVTPIVKSADLAVCNLEVTFGGSNREYSSFPLFNTPDTLADALKSAGYDVILTSNNHSYDTGAKGLKRTPQVLKDKGFISTGTRINESDKPYVIQNVNGINIGIINYTYETPSANGKKALNGNFMTHDAGKLVNSFNYDKLPEFYSEIKARFNDMKKDGAEAIMLYMHWGDEYKLSPNSYQEEIANKMCEYGVDVLVGGHPHVIEPVEVIHNKKTNNKMVCLYSMGNALSNQRVALMGLKTGHTEDGIMFYTTFEKYGNGEVKLAKIDYIPTWINIATISNKRIHQIIPLKDLTANKQNYGLTTQTLQQARNSYSRTQELVEKGVNKFNNIQVEEPTTEKQAA